MTQVEKANPSRFRRGPCVGLCGAAHAMTILLAAPQRRGLCPPPSPVAALTLAHVYTRKPRGAGGPKQTIPRGVETSRRDRGRGRVCLRGGEEQGPPQAIQRRDAVQGLGAAGAFDLADEQVEHQIKLGQGRQYEPASWAKREFRWRAYIVACVCTNAKGPRGALRQQP